ncbi:MAG TPA: hypothetical protein VK717_03405 [Opitutaceae bacterium]|jgi:hypothetical protein|nr:hypothetical protein [Opitutaceae bacterium]
MSVCLRLCLFFFPTAFFLSPGACRGAEVPVEEMRRLYDFTPVGPGNPVVVRVPQYGIEIPVSEFRACVATQLGGTARAALTPADKRRYLDALLDDHLLLWNGYEQKADQTKDVAGMLKSTQTMLLEEVLTQQELATQGKPPEQGKELLGKLRDQLFGRMDITVSNESYARLKDEVLRMERTAGVMETLGKPGAAAKEVSLSADVRDLSLARCKFGVITVGEFLQTYNRMPATQRPDLQSHEGVIAVFKQMLGTDLLIAEARSRGLEKSPMVREKMQLNRNVLTRLYALDQLTARAEAQMKSPEIETRLKEWYEANLKKLYTVKAGDGTVHAVSFTAEKERIGDDYFRDLQERIRADQIRVWRKGCSVEIDQSVLAKAAL